jgi:hypothetical protein
MPQVVSTLTYSSSAGPSQSSSSPLQVLSSGEVGAPGAHESTSAPATQVSEPEAWQTPRPQLVAVTA